MKYLKYFENNNDENLITIEEILLPFSDDGLKVNINKFNKTYHSIIIESINYYHGSFDINEYEDSINTLLNYFKLNSIKITKIEVSSQMWDPHEVCPRCENDSDDGKGYGFSDIENDEGGIIYKCEKCNYVDSADAFIQNSYFISIEELFNNDNDELNRMEITFTI